MAKSKDDGAATASDEGPATHRKGGAIRGGRLKAFYKRLDKLEADKKDISDGIRSVYGEAKAEGFDPKIMRQVYRLRAMDAEAREEDLGLLETYLEAAGLGPLFDRALDDDDDAVEETEEDGTPLQH